MPLTPEMLATLTSGGYRGPNPVTTVGRGNTNFGGYPGAGGVLPGVMGGMPPGAMPPGVGMPPGAGMMPPGAGMMPPGVPPVVPPGVPAGPPPGIPQMPMRRIGNPVQGQQQVIPLPRINFAG